MTAPAYDPAIIERYASDLYARASNIIWKWGCIGMAVGALLAMGAIQSAGELAPSWRLGLMAAGVLLGLLVGRSIGTDRAFSLWLQAQTALCQAAIEKNTRRS